MFWPISSSRCKKKRREFIFAKCLSFEQLHSNTMSRLRRLFFCNVQRFMLLQDKIKLSLETTVWYWVLLQPKSFCCFCKMLLAREDVLPLNYVLPLNRSTLYIHIYRKPKTNKKKHTSISPDWNLDNNSLNSCLIVVKLSWK